MVSIFRVKSSVCVVLLLPWTKVVLRQICCRSILLAKRESVLGKTMRTIRKSQEELSLSVYEPTHKCLWVGISRCAYEAHPSTSPFLRLPTAKLFRTLNACHVIRETYETNFLIFPEIYSHKILMHLAFCV